MHLRSGVGASTITQGAGPGEIWEFRERVEQQKYGFYMFLYGILSIEDLDFSHKEWQKKNHRVVFHLFKKF